MRGHTDAPRLVWLIGGLCCAALVAYACLDAGRPVRPGPPAADVAGPSGATFTYALPDPVDNQHQVAPTATGQMLEDGVTYRVTATGALTFEVNQDRLFYGPPAPLPGGLSSVGPAGFPPAVQNGPRAFAVLVGLSSAGPFVHWQPGDPGAETVQALIQGPGQLFVGRGPPLNGGVGCAGNPYPYGYCACRNHLCLDNQPDYLVHGTQTVTLEPVPLRLLQASITVTPGEGPPVLNPRCGSTPGDFAVTTTVSWSDGSSPAGVSVALNSEYEGGSGGHAHQPDDRPGFGHFDATSGQVDASGVFTTHYHPGIVGDIERLTAVVSGSDQSDTATTEVRIRVPGLIRLLSGGNVEIGGATPNHPLNTFGTGLTIGKIIVLADSFYAQTGVRIPFNDMSLEFGGVFDEQSLDFTPSDVSPGHLGHRCGQEVDVVDKVGDRTPVLEEYLRAVVRSPLVQGFFYEHGPGSYHLRFVRSP